MQLVKKRPLRLWGDRYYRIDLGFVRQPARCMAVEGVESGFGWGKLVASVGTSEGAIVGACKGEASSSLGVLLGYPVGMLNRREGTIVGVLVCDPVGHGEGMLEDGEFECGPTEGTLNGDIDDIATVGNAEGLRVDG